MVNKYLKIVIDDIRKKEVSKKKCKRIPIASHSTIESFELLEVAKTI